MDLQQHLVDISLRTMSQLHRAIVHLTGGQVLGSAFGMPVVELHTVGRKSDLPTATRAGHCGTAVRPASSVSCGPAQRRISREAG
jgi:hypothetical protein